MPEEWRKSTRPKEFVEKLVREYPSSINLVEDEESQEEKSGKKRKHNDV